jgi:hypothetical protein
VQAWLGPAVVAAVVAALFSVLREVLLDRRSRSRRERDLQIALAAEIRAHVAALERDDLEAYGEAMTARILEAGDGPGAFTPFIPSERNDTVFAAVLPEVQVLPEGVIDGVVVYYQQLAAISALIEDMRGARYAELPAARRADVYASYVSMKREALRLGRLALDDLAASLAAPRRRLSSRASGRSGR